jgi:hypothetical protein
MRDRVATAAAIENSRITGGEPGAQLDSNQRSSGSGA